MRVCTLITMDTPGRHLEENTGVFAFCSGVRFFAEVLAFPAGGALAFAFFGGGDGLDTAAETTGPAGAALAGTAGVLLEGSRVLFGLFKACSMERAFRSSRSSTTSCCSLSHKKLKSRSYDKGSAHLI